jgi:simple sugar transport system ATP-binding protein
MSSALPVAVAMREVVKRFPGALAAGVGMVHQYFMLIPRFTVAEDLTLGAEVRRH